MQRTTRMKKELEMLEKDPPHGISCWPVEDQLDHLAAREDLFSCSSSFLLFFNNLSVSVNDEQKSKGLRIHRMRVGSLAWRFGSLRGVFLYSNFVCGALRVATHFKKLVHF